MDRMKNRYGELSASRQATIDRLVNGLASYPGVTIAALADDVLRWLDLTEYVRAGERTFEEEED